MISFEQSMITIMVLYASSTIIGIIGLMLRKQPLRILASALAIGGFALQTFDMMRGSHSLMPGGLSGGTYLQILAWFMIICGMGGQWKLRSTTPLLFITPLALMLFLMSWSFLHIQVTLPESLGGPFYALHIGSLYLSLALMALAFAAGIIFIYVEKLLKSKAALTGFIQDFPALDILDKINSICVVVGFPLFTLGILSGFLWAGSTWGNTVSGDPKEIISLVIWAVYAWLFHMRVVQGRRGRKPATMALWLFGLSVFSILIVNSFMDTHHAFTKRQ